MLEIMHRIKIGTMAAELPVLILLTRFLRYVPNAILPTALHSNNTRVNETKTSAANAKASDNSNTIFAGVAAEAEKGELLNDEDISSEAGIFTVAGTDTTAVTMTYLVWCVLSRPEIREKVEEEVAVLSDDYTDNDLLKLPWLNGIIAETLRLYGPISSALPRVTPPDGAVLGGISIPGGTLISTQSYTIHRDPELFPRPLE